MSHNPFGVTDNNNPWSGGPKYGNAYEDPSPSPSPALPPRVKETPTLVPSSPFVPQAMPSPSNYQTQPPVNAWQQHQESNKTLEESTHNNTNAYQYSGTAYGNSPNVTSAYSPQPINTENATTTESAVPNQKAESVIATSATSEHPSKLKVLFRIILLIFSVGHLGFAAGASPYSGVSVPLDSKACFYYLFAVAIWKCTKDEKSSFDFM